MPARQWVFADQVVGELLDSGAVLLGLPSSVVSPQPTRPLSVEIFTSRVRIRGKNCSMRTILTGDASPPTIIRPEYSGRPG